jgi:RNA polymerase sigma-70 factor (ECF subfamily)
MLRVGLGPTALEDVRAARAATRDRQVATALLTRLEPRVSRVVAKLAGQGAEFHDYVQVCLLEVLKALPSFNGSSSLETWASAVTFRTLMRQLKRQRRRERTVLVDSEATLRDDGTPAHALERARLLQRLSQHLDRLPEERRSALLLRVGLGHSVAEVAEITGAPHNTVRDRLRVGLRELRASMAGDTNLIALLTEDAS